MQLDAVKCAFSILIAEDYVPMSATTVVLLYFKSIHSSKAAFEKMTSGKGDFFLSVFKCSVKLVKWLIDCKTSPQTEVFLILILLLFFLPTVS